MKKISVMASGKGSNLQALIDSVEQGFIPADISLIVSDNPGAGALEKANKHGLESMVINPEEFASRKEMEKVLVSSLQERSVEMVVLAGFMRVLSPYFISAFPDKIINIHPSLLPAFPGVDAVQQALEYGAKVTGCTVHLVEEKVDSGPIIMQEAVPVLQEDSIVSLQQRIHAAEHRCYPRALELFCKDKIIFRGRRCYLYEE